ncbi:hypothetical protein HELRODRAFT_185072 [Helobdella robusta]|uniref:G-protein coupled receptors family 1 profile domain-containing protein n=1 Tax=Helobdella robusta TaxID=6412 RepID=T1FMD0_HELRO|nr:hypothetical protein HELRODRAFT_185072 [Helobdella robusta]ESN96208.1 hypothetical protein HELRODRAFT_185072 [Helobdella robusta]
MWFTKIVLWGAINASIYSVVILNFERYIAVVYPIFHKTKFTKSKMYSIIMLLTVWVFGIGFKFFYSIISSGIVKNGQCSSFTEYPSKTMQKVIGIFIFIFDYCLPLTLLTCMYLRMAVFLHNKIQPGSETTTTGQNIKLGAENSTVYSVQTSKIEMEASNVGEVNEDVESCVCDDNRKDLSAHVNINAPNHLHQPNIISSANVQKMKPKSTMARARDNILKTSMILSLSFAMCITLNEVYFFLASIFLLSLSGWLYQLSVILVFMNSCFNPIIYCLKYDPFKKKVQYAYKNFKKLIKK